MQSVSTMTFTVRILVFIVVMAAVPVHSAVLRVGPGGDFASIQDAVDAAVPNDEIRIAGGTFTGVTSRPAPVSYTGAATVVQVVYIDKELVIRGGFDTLYTEPPDPLTNPTVINGDSKGRCIFVTGSISPRILGVTCTSGDATGLGGALWGDAGGGIFVDGSSMKLGFHSQVHHCTAGSGGGVFLSYCTDAEIDDVIIEDNVAVDYAGGLYAHATTGHIRTSEIARNSCTGIGGGIHTGYNDFEINDNLIEQNSADTYGGGIGLYYSNAPLLNNLVIDNTGGAGGAVWSSNGHGPFDANSFSGNSATDTGGALFLEECHHRITNSFIALNTASTGTSGIHVAGGSPEFINNSMHMNTGGNGATIYAGDYMGNLSSFGMYNTIFSDGDTGIYAAAGCGVLVNGTLWWNNITDVDGPGTVTPGGVDLTGDPLFRSFHPGDLHLEPGSAAADTGVSMGVTTDIDGHSRPMGAGYDIGADEMPTLGVDVVMPVTEVSYLDLFLVDGILFNPGPDMTDVPVFFILDVYANYYFWPSWSYFSASGGSIDYDIRNVPTGRWDVSVIPPMLWPYTTGGPVTGLYFHGAMLNSSLTAIVGEMDSVEWGYGY